MRKKLYITCAIIITNELLIRNICHPLTLWWGSWKKINAMSVRQNVPIPRTWYIRNTVVVWGKISCNQYVVYTVNKTIKKKHYDSKSHSLICFHSVWYTDYYSIFNARVFVFNLLSPELSNLSPRTWSGVHSSCSRFRVKPGMTKK